VFDQAGAFLGLLCGPNKAYVQDITYIWTQEGWSMGSRMTAQFVCDALTMAIWQRQPKAGLIVHSDRGSQ